MLGMVSLRLSPKSMSVLSHGWAENQSTPCPDLSILNEGHQSLSALTNLCRLITPSFGSAISYLTLHWRPETLSVTAHKYARSSLLIVFRIPGGGERGVRWKISWEVMTDLTKVHHLAANHLHNIILKNRTTSFEKSTRKTIGTGFCRKKWRSLKQNLGRARLKETHKICSETHHFNGH